MTAPKQRLLALSAAALSLFVSSVPAAPSPKELEAVAEQAVAARRKMMQQGATAADVDALMALCTDNLVYEDPVVNMRIEGKDPIREGISSFLGASRRARTVVTKRISAANVVVFEQTVSFTAEDGDHNRDQVTVFEFDGAKIRRIADYWAR